MFLRYVPATDFGYIQKYARFAKGAEKYVAFLSPELLSKYEKMLEKDLALYKVNYTKNLVTEDSYNETKEITQEGFSTVLELYEKILPQIQPMKAFSYSIIVGLAGIAGSLLFFFLSSNENIFILICISFVFLIFGVFGYNKERDDCSCFRSRAWWCYKFIINTSSYDDYVKNYSALDWDQQPIFKEDLKITIPESLDQHYHLAHRHLSRENESGPGKLVLAILAIIGLVIFYIIVLD